MHCHILTNIRALKVRHVVWNEKSNVHLGILQLLLRRSRHSSLSELRSLTPESHVSYSPSDWLDAPPSCWPKSLLSESSSSDKSSKEAARPLSEKRVLLSQWFHFWVEMKFSYLWSNVFKTNLVEEQLELVGNWLVLSILHEVGPWSSAGILVCHAADSLWTWGAPTNEHGKRDYYIKCNDAVEKLIRI